jgi:transcriptional regulator with XRE-family HTH domain
MSDHDVASLVRALRGGLGLSQEVAAERGGILRTELSTIENGRNKASSYEMRGALSRAFDLTLEALDDYLAGRSDLRETLHRSGLPKPSAVA